MLALLGILLVAVSNGGQLKAITAACVGLLLATVGRDGFTGAERFTFDSHSMAGGKEARQGPVPIRQRRGRH